MRIDNCQDAVIALSAVPSFEGLDAAILESIVVPHRASRGVEAETRLAFLGTQAVVKKKENNRKPLVAISLMIVIMVALMSISGLMYGAANPTALMFSNSSGPGLGMWGVMLVPVAGLFLMLVMMFVVFRRMTGHGGPMSGMPGHGGLMSRLIGSNPKPPVLSRDANLTTVVHKLSPLPDEDRT
jgi:hypothetical protein